MTVEELLDELLQLIEERPHIGQYRVTSERLHKLSSVKVHSETSSVSLSFRGEALKDD